MNRRRIVSATVAPAPAPPSPLFHANYDLLPDGSTQVDRVWTSGVQRPSSPGSSGTLQVDRMRIVSGANVPGLGDPYRPSGNAMRVELRPFHATAGNDDGDVTNIGGAFTSRAEVLREAAPNTLVPSLWPDPPGSERWYSWSVYLDPTWTYTADSVTDWLVLTQWKPTTPGVPILSLTLTGNRFTLTGDGATDLGPATAGVWHRFIWHVGWGVSGGAGGFTEIFRNGSTALVRGGRQTMVFQADGTTVDANTFKQGIYRSSTWATTHIAYFGPTKVGDSLLAVA